VKYLTLGVVEAFFGHLSVGMYLWISRPDISSFYASATMYCPDFSGFQFTVSARGDTEHKKPLIKESRCCLKDDRKQSI